ncbi:MAG: lysophospholipid acyltransferase family protein [Ignavibacteriales bacterium]|nr:lysophospholipid acyltransferase family protein [Ignavibacteriales bacterium]
MILKAKHHWFLYPFFRWYGRRLLKKHFYKIIIKSNFENKNLPILLIGNHFSWWDGFFVSYLNDKLFHRKLFIMMEEKQLLEYKFFSKTGCFSIKKGSRSVLETLEYSRELLKDKNNLVVLFPQGVIESLYKEELKFEKGIERIIKNLEKEIQIVFMVNLIDYFSQKRPYLFSYLKEYELKKFSIENIQNYFNKFIEDSKKENICFPNKL